LSFAVEEPESCSYEPSSSVPPPPSAAAAAATDDLLSSSGAGALADAYPSTSSTTDNIFEEKTFRSCQQLSRNIRRRCKFLLSPSISRKLLRIALKQPVTLNRLGISSVKVGESDLLSVAVSDAASLNLLSLSYPSAAAVPEMNSLVGIPVEGAVAADHARLAYDTYQGETSRHELAPSTSTGRAAGKRKVTAPSFDGDMYSTPAAMHGRLEMAAAAPPPMAAVASTKQQPAANTNSPTLVNLLRSSSPGASVAVASIHNPQHVHMQRPSAVPLMQHMAAPSPQAQGTTAVGYSQYSYVSQGSAGPSVQPCRMRAATPVEASHLTPTSMHSHPEQQQQQQQQQIRPMQQEVLSLTSKSTRFSRMMWKSRCASTPFVH
uniref:BHLH domain-containing protein n=1 Tax=Gongylonema pulchrum TaxID=637853 RepID=A0A183DRZ5_9BILA